MTGPDSLSLLASLQSLVGPTLEFATTRWREMALSPEPMKLGPAFATELVALSAATMISRSPGMQAASVWLAAGAAGALAGGMLGSELQLTGTRARSLCLSLGMLLPLTVWFLDRRVWPVRAARRTQQVRPPATPAATPLPSPGRVAGALSAAPVTAATAAPAATNSRGRSPAPPVARRSASAPAPAAAPGSPAPKAAPLSGRAPWRDPEVLAAAPPPPAPAPTLATVSPQPRAAGATSAPVTVARTVSIDLSWGHAEEDNTTGTTRHRNTDRT